MDSLSSKCTEEANSTDCLLRAIINFLEDRRRKMKQSSTAGFALITIVQAILAAGPGRRKSNSEAIGKWAKHTKWKWQFCDVGYLHIANTPILTIENVLAYLELQNNYAKGVGKSSDTRAKKDRWQSSNRSKSLAASAAKWLVFLNKVKLSHLELPDEALETWLADYLPGDLLAVPALVELRFIYMFMILSYKDFLVLGTDSRYPILIGKDFQFEVRQHPTLGSVATFSTYRKVPRKTWIATVPPEGLSLFAQQAQGAVPTSIAPIRMEGDTAAEKTLQDREWICLLESGVLDHMDFSRQTHLSGSTFHGHWRFCTFAAHKDYGRWRESAFAPLSLNSATLFALIFADIPKAIPEIFPRDRLDFRGIFEALSISADITIKDKLDLDKETTENDYHLLDLVFLSSRYEYEECPLIPELQLLHGPSERRCQLIVRECKTIPQSCDTPGGGTLGIASEKISQSRTDAIDMLLVVESWLRGQSSQREVRCTSSIFPVKLPTAAHRKLSQI